MKAKQGRRRKTLVLVTAILTLSGIACLITGIVLLVKRNSTICEKTTGQVDRCSYSEEAKRSGLDVFLQKVQDKTFELHPFLIAQKPKVSAREIRDKYKAYDPSPLNLKRITDSARTLLKELSGKEIKTTKLKSRERKSLAQLKHFLKHVFGTPFDGNYYFGDFLLGPNMFCWQHICSVGQSLRISLPFFKPSDAYGLEILIDKLQETNKTFQTYTDNLRYGVRAGMVRSVEECRAGLDAMKRSNFNISLEGPEGNIISP